MEFQKMVHFRTRPGELAALERLARALGTSQSDVMRTLVSAADLVGRQNPTELRRLARAKQAAEKSGRSYFEEYMLCLTREIHEVEGLPLSEAWIEASRRQPLSDTYLALKLSEAT